MWNFKLSLTILFFAFSLQSAWGATQLGLQYISESTYRNTLGPLVLFKPKSLLQGNIDFGFGFLFSDKDWESVSYRTQLELPFASWCSLSFRAAHRIQLPETFSRTSFLGQLNFISFPVGPFGFHLRGGWYRRFSFLQKASLVPFVSKSDFSQHDFAVDLGVTTQMSPSLQWKLKVATVDELEVYNLNHPFVESAFAIFDSQSQRTWQATFRYQLSLGFGRLDRLSVGLSLVDEF